MNEQQKNQIEEKINNEVEETTKKITKYWYKLNKFTPGSLNSDPYIINFFQI